MCLFGVSAYSLSQVEAGCMCFVYTGTMLQLPPLKSRRLQTKMLSYICTECTLRRICMRLSSLWTMFGSHTAKAMHI